MTAPNFRIVQTQKTGCPTASVRDTAPVIRVGRYIFLDNVTADSGGTIRAQAVEIAGKVLSLLHEAGGDVRCLTELTLYVAREVPREDMVAAALVLSRDLGAIVHDADWIKFNFLREEGVLISLRGAAVLPYDGPATTVGRRRRSRVTASGRLRAA